MNEQVVDEQIRTAIQAHLHAHVPAVWESDDAGENLLRTVTIKAPHRHVPWYRHPRVSRSVAVAAVLVVLGAGWWSTRSSTHPPVHPPTVEADRSAVEQAFTWLSQHGSGRALGGPLWQPTFSPALSAVVQVNPALNTYGVNLWNTRTPYPVNSRRLMQGRIGVQPIIGWTVTRGTPESLTVMEATTAWIQPTGPSRTISLGVGVHAQIYTQGASGQNTIAGVEILTWQQGGWHFELTSRQPTPSVVQTGHALARFTTSHPLPHGPGVVTAQVPAGQDPAAPATTAVVWATHGVTIHFTNLMPGTSNPVNAVHMVTSWRWMS